MKRFATLLGCLPSLVVAICLAPTPAYGWSDAGHKVVASIAFRQLTLAEQQKVIAILEAHPRFEADFAKKMPDAIAEGRESEKYEWLFQQAAVWPDMARRFSGPLGEQFHRGNWHFINLPLFLTAADEKALKGRLTVNVSLVAPAQGATEKVKTEMNVIQAIRYARKVLSDRAATKADKALMLSWVFHLVGDIHQPLHSTALFSRRAFPEGDRGGNAIPTEQLESLGLTKIYLQTAGSEANKRVVQAGFRLGAILKTIVAE